jgi:hypothetical protein
MQLILPDVLAAARGLSLGATLFLVLVGLCLWALGWRWHRFWVVFGITLGAGVLGLSAGQASGGQVMVIGILLAVTAGMLALELARIMAFVTGGTAGWMAAQAVLPQAHELWAVFLSGGLLGVVLYQLWTMLTTSLLGALVAGHAGLLLAETFGGTDAAGVAGKHVAALNGAVLTACLVGVLVQTKLAPRPKADADEADDKGKNAKKSVAHDDLHDNHPSEPKGSAWWKRVVPGKRAA